MKSSAPEDKTCVSCGRRIEWRAAWARDWDQVRYCSAACRRRGVTAVDHDLEERILAMLAGRGARATVDAAEVARAAAGDEPWAPFVEPVRRAARRLVARDEVVIVQGGAVVDPSTAKGPIGIRRP